jgi:aspartate/methionine/tyrosine aminotransferase
MRERVHRNLDFALDRLAASPRFRTHAPDGGYYLFPEVRGWSDEEELVLHLLEHGVLAHPGYFYGYEVGTHLMISCLTEPASFAEGIDRLIGAVERP